MLDKRFSKLTPAELESLENLAEFSDFKLALDAMFSQFGLGMLTAFARSSFRQQLFIQQVRRDTIARNAQRASAAPLPLAAE
jgi:hypothetical protein